MNEQERLMYVNGR